MLSAVQAAELDEEALFSTIARSGVRALLIGRRALVALGIPPILVPCIDDIILTKGWSLRPKDVDDIAMLEKLKQGGGPTS
jgi:hypothetical protein